MEIFLDDGASYENTVLANLLEHLWPHIWNNQRTKNKNKTHTQKKAYSEEMGQHFRAAIVVCIIEAEFTQFASLCLAFLSFFVWLLSLDFVTSRSFVLLNVLGLIVEEIECAANVGLY